MALQSTDPGAAFADMANAFATRPLGEADLVTLKRFEEITLREYRRTFAAFTHLTLQPEFDLFGSSAGPVASALATLGAAHPQGASFSGLVRRHRPYKRRISVRPNRGARFA